MPTAKYFYQGNKLISVLASGQPARYLRAEEMILSELVAGAPTASLLACELGGTVTVAAVSEDLSPFKYTPFGLRYKTLSETTQLGFNGEYLRPELGAYLLGNGYRAFNPKLMRFTAPDSFGPFVVLNVYGYCGGDPVNRRDPSGHITVNRMNKFKAHKKNLNKAINEVSVISGRLPKGGVRENLTVVVGDSMADRAFKSLEKTHSEFASSLGWMKRKSQKGKYIEIHDEINSVIVSFEAAYDKAAVDIASWHTLSYPDWSSTDRIGLRLVNEHVKLEQGLGKLDKYTPEEWSRAIRSGRQQARSLNKK